MKNVSFSILISTRNRKIDLTATLGKIQNLLEQKIIECVVFDDGSTDGTFEFIKQNFPQVVLLRNEICKGYLFCRNKMLNETGADYAISLDDDAHFSSEVPLLKTKDHFEEHPNAGLLAFRIFWGLNEPIFKESNEKSEQVQGFVGCAHVWRMEAWRSIPNYPEWFVFYGEEDFASYQLFKKNWEIHYLPEVLVHHRVDIKARKNNADYGLRLRRSLRSGWYLYFLFFPIRVIPRVLTYSIWMQVKSKVFKADWKALGAILLAMVDLVFAIPKIIKNSNRLTDTEYEAYQKLASTKLYWKPKDEINS